MKGLNTINISRRDTLPNVLQRTLQPGKLWLGDAVSPHPAQLRHRLQ